MAHGLICGMTESGKSTLAKRLSAELIAAGITVLVLDPIQDPGWHTQYATADQSQFLQWYWNSRSCVAFIDESGEAVGRYNDVMNRTATKGRHWGHSNFYIAQEATQIAPLVRGQCSSLYLFTSAAKEGERMAAEFNAPELLQCTTLPRGQYFKAGRFQPVQRGRVF